MVEVARERVSSLSRFEMVDACQADAQDLPFDEEAFDVVVANHMLYHLPDPARAVAEFARVLRPNGVVMAATNGPRHLHELWEVRSEVFGGPPVSETTEVFGSESGVAIVRRSLANVEWRGFDDELRCTNPDDVVAYLTSAPPGEDASHDQLRRLRQAVERRFAVGGGVFAVSKETGVFLARGPVRSLASTLTYWRRPRAWCEMPLRAQVATGAVSHTRLLGHPR